MTEEFPEVIYLLPGTGEGGEATWCDDPAPGWAMDPDDAIRYVKQPHDNNAAVAAIQFALEDDEGLLFLRYWNEGEFDVLRREWPEAPEEVYIGADPLYQPEENTDDDED